MSILLLKLGNADFMVRTRILLKIPHVEGFSLYSRDWFFTAGKHFRVSRYANLHLIRQYFGQKGPIYQELRILTILVVKISVPQVSTSLTRISVYRESSWRSLTVVK